MPRKMTPELVEVARTSMTNVLRGNKTMLGAALQRIVDACGTAADAAKVRRLADAAQATYDSLADGYNACYGQLLQLELHHATTRAPRQVWVYKGEVTDPEAHGGGKVGHAEWQFSDGPVGQRGYSQDYLSLAEGLREHSGCVIHWEDE